MDGTDHGRKRAGFKERTPLAEALKRLEGAIPNEVPKPVSIPLREADGRVLTTAVRATRDVPHYDRAAMDGYAVRGADTVGATNRSPAVLELETDSVSPGHAVRVHTGSPLPAGADAVVMIEHAERFSEELEVTVAVAEGENVAPVGEDVEEGTSRFDSGHRLRPSDLGLLRSVGIEQVLVAPRPTVGVIPTGEELVDPGCEPAPGEVVETNGLTVSALVGRWGGRATYRDVVTDDREALRVAIQRDLTKDVIVTTGGSSVGERDLLPEVIDDLGTVLVHGVGLKPGHPVAIGVVEETPVICLPGYPVAAIVNAVQFLEPTIAWLQGATPTTHPTVEATLERKLPSEPGTRTFARVRLEERDGERFAVPTRASGAGVLSSVALADGWVVIDEPLEGIAAGERVSVERWE